MCTIALCPKPPSPRGVPTFKPGLGSRSIAPPCCALPAAERSFHHTDPALLWVPRRPGTKRVSGPHVMLAHERFILTAKRALASQAVSRPQLQGLHAMSRIVKTLCTQNGPQRRPLAGRIQSAQPTVLRLARVFVSLERACERSLAQSKYSQLAASTRELLGASPHGVSRPFSHA